MRRASGWASGRCCRGRRRGWMPTQRLSMRRIKQLLTMRFGAGASTREIARELGIAPSTVREYLGRAAAAGIGWPLAADITDESLLARLNSLEMRRLGMSRRQL